jgi:hypothetical protein
LKRVHLFFSFTRPFYYLLPKAYAFSFCSGKIPFYALLSSDGHLPPQGDILLEDNALFLKIIFSLFSKVLFCFSQRNLLSVPSTS